MEYISISDKVWGDLDVYYEATTKIERVATESEQVQGGDQQDTIHDIEVIDTIRVDEVDTIPGALLDFTKDGKSFRDIIADLVKKEYRNEQLLEHGIWETSFQPFMDIEFHR